jgi:diguanylate cyclase (GGDEF)-like protein
MQLDNVTLIAMGCLAIGLSGILLALVWTQMRRDVALLWWAAAHTVNATGTFLILAYHNGPEILVLAGLLISGLSPILLFAGAWAFTRGRARLDAVLVAGLLFILATSAIYGGAGIVDASAASFIVWIVMMSATIAELWRSRREPLPARWGLIVLFAIHAVVYSAGLQDLAAGNIGSGALPDLNSWFGLIYFEGLAYAIGTAAFMVLLCKERAEHKLIRAGHTDGLTGAANRTALFDSGERLLRRCRENHLPLSLIVFDLDRFKQINDTYGHHTGDLVLAAFADVVRGVLRPSDIFGRHGGEEFAVLLPGASIEAAFVIAERIRHSLGETTTSVNGIAIAATVSAGVATAADGQSFQSTLDAADSAMYQAKNRGRNRVERAPDDRPTGDAKVVRVA